MMKKLLLIGLVITAVSGLVYASSNVAYEHGAHKFIANLNLDESRTTEVIDILNSYKQIKDLAMNGKFEEIPQFIQDKEVELAQVLSEEEMAQFKQNVGKWAEGKDFSKYQKYAEKYSKKHN